jgi:ssDNA-binding Zn-finger/Zn-ribbon topoisomerase 1
MGGMCEPKEEYKRPGAVKCPECGSTDLSFGDEDFKNLICPHCQKGKLTLEMRMIS